jgi:histidine triad (HIT) family protein
VSLEPNCIFCKIIEKKIPSKTVYEDHLVTAFEDVNPQAPVHLLVVPKNIFPRFIACPQPIKILLGTFFDCKENR